MGSVCQYWVVSAVTFSQGLEELSTSLDWRSNLHMLLLFVRTGWAAGSVTQRITCSSCLLLHQLPARGLFWILCFPTVKITDCVSNTIRICGFVYSHVHQLMDPNVKKPKCLVITELFWRLNWQATNYWTETVTLWWIIWVTILPVLICHWSFSLWPTTLIHVHIHT